MKSDVVNHIDHIRTIAGVDHIGIGSDFNGVYHVPIISTFELETGQATKSLYVWHLLYPHYNVHQVSIFINHVNNL